MKYQLNEVLLSKIEKTRNKMILFGQQYGLASSKTIRISKQLDCLLNAFSCLESTSFYSNPQIKIELLKG